MSCFNGGFIINKIVNNDKNKLVKNSSIGTVSNILWSFLDSESKFNLMSSCKSMRKNITNNINPGRFEQIKKTIEQCKKLGLSFKFEGKSSVKMNILPIGSVAFAENYYYRIKMLNFLMQEKFITQKYFRDFSESVNNRFYSYLKERLLKRDNKFLSDMFTKIFDKDESEGKTLFFAILMSLKGTINCITTDEGFYYYSEEFRDEIDKSMYNLVGSLFEVVYKKEKNMPSVFEFAVNFFNHLCLFSAKIQEIDELIQKLIFEYIVYLAEKNNHKIEFKCLVYFCKKTGWLKRPNCNSDDFAKIFKGKVSSLESDYSREVASELREKLGKNDYLSLWKKENRKSKSVKTVNRKPRSSECVKKIHK